MVVSNIMTKSFDSISPSYSYDGMAGDANVPAAMPFSNSESSSTASSIVAVNSVTGTFSNIEQKYCIDHDQAVGTGHYSTVKQCTNRVTGRRFAVKSINKSNPAVKMNELHREVKLLQEVDHDSIIQLVDVYEDAEYLHLVTNLYSGGELYYKMVEKKIESRGATCFTEEESAIILRQVLEAVSYLHSRDIVHRDIKPENLVFESDKDDLSIKLVDFGLARKHYQSSFEPYMSEVCGTSFFIPPEVLRKKYDRSVDLWSVGVTAFILLGGYPPFNGRNNKEVYGAIKRGKFQFHAKYFKNVSKEAKDFISRLLRVNVKKRMTAEEALRHPWITKHTSKNDSSTSTTSTASAKEVLQDKTQSDVVSKQPRFLFGGIRHRKAKSSMFHF